MLHDVVYNTSEKDLERNFSYDYIYLNEPQKVIVLRNATHQPTHKLNLWFLKIESYTLISIVNFMSYD